MKKLLDNGELERAESKSLAQLQRATYLFLGLFFVRPGRGNQRQLTPTFLSLPKIHQGVEYLGLTEVGSKFYQPRRTIR